MFKFTANHDDIGASLRQAQSLRMTDAASAADYDSSLACQIK
jgi:hypothetical protein